MLTIASIDDPQVQRVLRDLHRSARKDWSIFLRAAPAVLAGMLRGQSLTASLAPRLADAYIPVNPEVGRFLYLTALVCGAKRVVEFGTSFGISTIYLAAAMQEAGGMVYGTEIEPQKIAQARINIRLAGLSDHAEVLAGDALETLRDIDAPVDMVLLDGWKDLYIPILNLLRPHLRPGSIVLADNIHTFRKELAPYVAMMRDPANGFRSATLSIGSGIEYSVFAG